MKKTLIFSILLLTITNHSFAQQYTFREPMSGVKSLFSNETPPIVEEEPPIGGEEPPINSGDDACVIENGGMFDVYQPLNAEGEAYLAFMLDYRGYSYRSPAFVINSYSYPNIEIVDDESVFKRGEILYNGDMNGVDVTSYELYICGTPNSEEPVDTTPPPPPPTPPTDTSECTIDGGGIFGVYEALDAEGEQFLAFISSSEGYSYRNPTLFVDSSTYPDTSLIEDESVFRRGSLMYSETNNGLLLSMYELYYCGLE